MSDPKKVQFTKEDAITFIATQLRPAGGLKNRELFEFHVGCEAKQLGVTILAAVLSQKNDVDPADAKALALFYDGMVAGAALANRNRRLR
jgi:hypothetical protein